MKTYLWTSELFTGEIEFRFDASGKLLGYENRAELNAHQLDAILGQLPRTSDRLEELIKSSSSSKLTEVKKDITFDKFWERYDDKVNSSKKRTKVKWDKMPKAEQVKAYNYISYYLSNLPGGTRKKFAETYLNAELWNN